MNINITGGAGAHLGDLFWWKAPRTWVDPAQVPIACGGTVSPFVLGLLPNAPEDVTAFRRAAAAARAGGKYDVRRVCDNQHEIAYTVTSVVADSVAKSAAYSHAATVEATLQNGVVTGVTSSGAAGDVVVATYKAMQGKLGAPEWTEFGCAFARGSRSIALRSQGGVYWLPAGKLSSELRGLAAVFSTMGGKVGIAPQFATSEGTYALGSAAKEGVLGDLHALAHEIATFNDRTRVTTLDARLVQLKELRERAAWTCDLLKEGADSILAGIKPLEAALVARLLESEPAAIDLSLYEPPEDAPF